MKTYNYQINKDGSIISNHTNKQISVSKCKKGYNRVRLKHSDGGKTYLVHRLIALTYIPNPNNYPQVNHLDGNKDNNSVDNLEWTTSKKNNEHAILLGLVKRGIERPNAKFTDDLIKEIRAGRELGMTYYELSDKFGASYQTMERICNRKTYTHVS